MARVSLFTRLQAKIESRVVTLRSQGADASRELVSSLVEDLQELAKVKAFSKGQTPWIRDELFVVALEQIYEGIRAAAVKLEDNNLVYYLAHRLNRCLPKAIYKMLNPGQSWDSNHAKDGRKNWSMTRRGLYLETDCVVWTEPEERLYETILSLCQTQEELDVVERLNLNETFREAAEYLGVSHTQVGNVRRRIHERYRDYVREEADNCIVRRGDRPEREDSSPIDGGVYDAPSETRSSADTILAGY